MNEVALHYWAGARAAAGREWDRVEAPSVGAALRAAVAGAGREQLASVLTACSLLVDGVALPAERLDVALTRDVVVEVLPPFAGG